MKIVVLAGSLAVVSLCLAAPASNGAKSQNPFTSKAAGTGDKTNHLLADGKHEVPDIKEQINAQHDQKPSTSELAKKPQRTPANLHLLQDRLHRPKRLRRSAYPDGGDEDTEIYTYQDLDDLASLLNTLQSIDEEAEAEAAVEEAAEEQPVAVELIPIEVDEDAFDRPRRPYNRGRQMPYRPRLTYSRGRRSDPLLMPAPLEAGEPVLVVEEVEDDDDDVDAGDLVDRLELADRLHRIARYLEESAKRRRK